MDKTVRIPAKRLSEFAQALLSAGGFTPEETKVIADSLTLSELMGHGSHGVMRVAEYLNDLKNGNTVSGAELRIILETATSLTVDARRGPGQVVMPEVLQKLYPKLKMQASVVAAVRNSGHIGRLGEWVEAPAKAGFAALLLVNDNGGITFVAPPGGKKAVTSTNPLAFAFPLPEGEIFSTDMSTSAVAYGKVKLAKLTNAQMPPDCIQDSEGKPTTNPAALFSDPAGSILPMGGTQGYKGFALSMFVDMLVAGLSGGYAPPAPSGIKYANNFTLILWNAEFFSGVEHLKNEAAKYIDFVRASPAIDAAKPIRLPGDRMNAVKREREANGIPLSDDLAQSLLRLAKELNVTALPELIN